MLLRRRLTGLDAIFGPLFDQNPPSDGAPTGDAGTGSPPANGGTGGGTPPPAPGQPPADDRSGWIPRDRFDQVNGELAKLRQAEQTRADDEARKKGDFETLSKREKEAREAAEAKATRVARRAAFISKAAGTVADADAAYKLALADGLLDDLKVDDEGDADPKDVEKIVADVVKRYEFLKGTDKKRDFGNDRGGTQPGAGAEPKTARDMLSAGYAAGGTSGFRQRG